MFGSSGDEPEAVLDVAGVNRDREAPLSGHIMSSTLSEAMRPVVLAEATDIADASYGMSGFCVSVIDSSSDPTTWVVPVVPSMSTSSASRVAMSPNIICPKPGSIGRPSGWVYPSCSPSCHSSVAASCNDALSMIPFLLHPGSRPPGVPPPPKHLPTRDRSAWS